MFWQELVEGYVCRTNRRTVTEADLVAFISATGMLETIFIDANADGAINGRPVPAALTYSFVEGMQMQSLVQGVGLALLEVSMKSVAPVRVGDTIWAIVCVAQVRPTSKGGRAVVTFEVRVFNQGEREVLHYTVKRLIAGNSA